MPTLAKGTLKIAEKSRVATGIFSPGNKINPAFDFSHAGGLSKLPCSIIVSQCR
jgi:hypothetical protein